MTVAMYDPMTVLFAKMYTVDRGYKVFLSFIDLLFGNKRSVLGTIGSFAIFHSHRQKKMTM
jgi:hypothetical protein